MLTTDMAAECAAARKLPTGTASAGPAGACSKATGPLPRGASQAGLRVKTTKYAANTTVVVWENSNQRRFIADFILVGRRVRQRKL